MSAPTKPINAMLVEAWHYRQNALLAGDEDKIFNWAKAFDELLDMFLAERPDLRG